MAKVFTLSQAKSNLFLNNFSKKKIKDLLSSPINLKVINYIDSNIFYFPRGGEKMNCVALLELSLSYLAETLVVKETQSFMKVRGVVPVMSSH